MKNFNPEILDQEGQEILFARVASNLLKEGKTEQATLISEVGIKKFPDYAQGHFVLAKCYQEKDMYEEARTEYERVLKYDSSHLGALKELSGLFLSSGLSDVYKDYLFRLLTLDPLNHSILDEAREQGVYDIWKSQGAIPFSKVEKIEPNEIGDTKEPEKEQNEKVDESITSQEDNLDDMAKMDLSQFENQEDDFNTIMDGLIQDSADENEETESLNYLEELETPVELENELLAEEKPVLDEDDIEMTTFDDSAEDEKKIPFYGNGF